MGEGEQAFCRAGENISSRISEQVFDQGNPLFGPVEEVDLNKELTPTDEVLSVEAITVDSRAGLEVIRHSTAHLLAAAVLDLPISSSANNDELLFEAFTEHIPPVGTPVTLIVRVKEGQ